MALNMLLDLGHASLILLVLAQGASALPADKRSERGPVLSSSFADPSVINVGGTWYAFSTAGNGVNVQVAESKDFDSWILDGGTDALPSLPGWANAPASNVWAPDVVAVGDAFVMYFSASTAQDGSKHCVGAATSTNIKGPYTALPDPLACPLERGGAIDPAGINDSGQYYVTYKVDGNSQGHGGECGNTVDPIVSTPIMLQKLAGDGVTPQGDPVQILDNNGAADEGIVEAPSIMRAQDGSHVLFFSSGCYSGSQYTVSYATSGSIMGPYTRHGSLIQSGAFGTTSPGGADIAADGSHMVFHAYQAGPVDTRTLYVAQVTVAGDKVTI